MSQETDSRSPERLFLSYAQQAEDIALTECWKNRISGSMYYQEEAKSEALMALWRACVEFDPSKQTLTLNHGEDPYDSFFKWATQRVRGRVVDWFRSYHLMARCGDKDGGGLKYRLPYHKMFLSMSGGKYWGHRWWRGMDNEGSSMNPNFDEYLPSKDRSDEYNEMESRRRLICGTMRCARLTKEEAMVVSLSYGCDELEDPEIAEVMGCDPSRVRDLRLSAIHNMRMVGREIQRTYLPKKEVCEA
jgi:RNA polymerase sigma factor (sigma-70 family)